MEPNPVLERTGNVFSFASSEYRVTYPDGHLGTIWSPPWHELDDDEEDAAALEAARELYRTGKHKDVRSGVTIPVSKALDATAGLSGTVSVDELARLLKEST